MRKILGIDVGTATTGWAVMEQDPTETNGLKLVECGAIVTTPDLPMPERLKSLHDRLVEIIDNFQPTEMAVESLFFFKNQKTVMTVSQGRGVILLAGAERNIPIFEYTPLQVKMGVTGYGRAEKKQVQKMVRLILGLSRDVRPDDAADAVAIAITHLNTTCVKKMLMTA
jgi:crossover junction endodeoxyribonuclease RuvC